MRKRNYFIFIVAVVTALAATWFYLSKQKSSGETAIRIIDSPTTPTNWELVQRLTGRDVLKEEEIKIQFIPGISSTVPRFQALLSNEVDVELANWVGWVNLIARGGKVKAVYAGAAVTRDIKDRSGILVLENSSIHSVKDLIGKTIAINTLGLDAEYSIKSILQKNGLSPDQIQLLQVPLENEEQALRTKQVDGIAGSMTGGTWFELAKYRGGVRLVPGTSHYEVIGHNATNLGVGFRDDFIQAHPDMVRRYVTAVEIAKRIIWDSFQKDPKHVRDIYAQILKDKGGNSLLAKFFLPVSPDSTFIKDSDIQFWIDLLVAQGKLQLGQIHPSDVYTNDYDSIAKDAIKDN